MYVLRGEEEETVAKIACTSGSSSRFCGFVRAYVGNPDEIAKKKLIFTRQQVAALQRLNIACKICVQL